MKVQSIKKNSKLGNYIPVPVCLLTSEFSSTTLLIYGSLLNRAMLSQKNDWHSNSGEVYVRFSIEELAKYVGKGVSTIKASLKELDEAGFIHRKRIDLYTTLIYVNAPECCFLGQNYGSLKPNNRTFKGEKAGLQSAENMTTNNKNELHNLVTDRYTYEEGESL